MEVSDFRIGNLVNYMDGNCICVIRELHSSNVYITILAPCKTNPPNPAHIKNIGGITLTDDWFKLMGFREILETSWEEEYYLPGVRIAKDRSGFFLRSGNTYINRNTFLYVHEIQNIYHAIARRDLELDFNKIELELVEGKMKLLDDEQS